MFRRVLLAVDFSPYTAKLLGCVPEMTRLGMEELLLLYVVDSRHAGMALYEMKTYAERTLEEMEGEVALPGLAVRKMVGMGVPPKEIIDTAAREGADLIYMGGHGKGFFSRLLLGSVSDRVLKLSDRPVLVHKCRLKGDKDEYSCENACELLFEKVLIATDFSQYSQDILPYIEELVESCCDDITLLHVREEDAKDGGAGDAEEGGALSRMERLRETAACLEPHCRLAEIRLETGSPVPTILEVAEEIGASLIVLGALGHRKIAEKLLGGVAEGVASRSERPVLVIRAEAGRSD
jgi:nucleotide-binding universal stress UspA family protein